MAGRQDAPAGRPLREDAPAGRPLREDAPAGRPLREERNWREIPFSPDVLESWHLDHGPEQAPDEARERLRAELVVVLRELIASSLTDRQRSIVRLYFFEGLTQAEIATELGISQQVVSRQLFGVVRNGKKVGGAIKRLRDLFVELGIEWV